MSSTPRSSMEERWASLSRFFVDNKLVVVILVILLTGAGLAFSPFRWSVGAVPRDPVAVDALPDISENQQIVFTRWPGRSPRDVEDQVTYPLTTALLGLPGVKSVRSNSMFGFSSIYVIFEDDIDFYWSRSRVLEKLSSLPTDTLPEGVAPTLGPDATALGQVFWYTLEPLDAEGKVVPGVFDPVELRTIQDWTVRYALQAVPGVSEVASVGGHVREYQVDVDPEALRAHDVTIGQVADAVSKANLDIGARTMEINQAEYVIRGVGFVESLEDLEAVVVAARQHTPIRVRDVAEVGFGPALRRGLLDKEGAEAVGGVVTVRFGDNPMAVIEAVKDKIAEIEPSLPRRTTADGTVARVKVVPFYDRTRLITETLDTLSDALLQQILITVVVVLLIMRHLRSSVLVSALLPLGVLATFVLMKGTGVAANIMALAGIAIAIGTMVDMGIVFVENMVQHLENAPEDESTAEVVARASGEVSGAVFTSVLTTILGFIPVFGLTGSEGRLFTPLAFTKTYALAAAFVLAVVVLPAVGGAILRRGSRSPVDSPARALLRREALFDWAIAGLGVALLWYHLVLPGLLIVGIGFLRLAEPLLPARLRRFAPWVANAITIVAVTIGLTRFWMPLGFGRDLAPNLTFVVLTVAVVIAAFWLFGLIYRPVLAWCLSHKFLFLGANVAFVLLGVGAWLGLGKVTDALPEPVRDTALVQRTAEVFPGLKEDFMPPFDEGSYLYMPTTAAHASIDQAREMLQAIDASIAQIPEVDQVVGKLGRAETALDPAPISMFETVVGYMPEYRQNTQGDILRFAYDEDSQTYLRNDGGDLIEDPDGRPYRQWREHIRTPADIWNEIVEAARYPGLTGAPKLMPIKTRIVMLQTGMRSAVGIKVRGPDLPTIEAFGLRLEQLIKAELGETVDTDSVLADRIVGKPYLEIDIDREAIGRYGLTIADVQRVLQVAVGGATLTRTVEGRERFPVRVRYMREERDSLRALEQVLISTPSGEQIPLRELTELRYVKGPQSIKSEDTFLTGYVTFDPVEGVGEMEAVEAVQAAIAEAIESDQLLVPEGISFRFAGTYENTQRARARLAVLVPLALSIIFILLYLQFRRTSTALMVFSGMALAAAGGFLLLWAYGQPWFLDFEILGTNLRTRGGADRRRLGGVLGAVRGGDRQRGHRRHLPDPAVP